MVSINSRWVCEAICVKYIKTRVRETRVKRVIIIRRMEPSAPETSSSTRRNSGVMRSNSESDLKSDNNRSIFYTINERPVDDISLEFFYKPHTLTLLAVSIAVVVYVAFTRDSESSLEENMWSGLCCVVFFFLMVSSLAFPNGPFTRPHPVVWRVVFGLSVLYLMGLLFLLFQNYQTVKNIMYWFYPDLKLFKIDHEKVCMN